MNKTVKTVFLLIGTLVLIFLIWQIMFKDGGVVRTVYDSMVNGIKLVQVRKFFQVGEKLEPTQVARNKASILTLINHERLLSSKGNSLNFWKEGSL